MRVRLRQMINTVPLVTMDEMEKMKGALHGDENDAAQETEQKRTA